MPRDPEPEPDPAEETEPAGDDAKTPYDTLKEQADALVELGGEEFAALCDSLGLKIASPMDVKDEHVPVLYMKLMEDRAAAEGGVK